MSNIESVVVVTLITLVIIIFTLYFITRPNIVNGITPGIPAIPIIPIPGTPAIPIVPIPTTPTRPFADGAKIKIRSLINNKYLIANVDLPVPDRILGIPLNGLVFEGLANNINANWTVCQNQIDKDTYAIYRGDISATNKVTIDFKNVGITSALLASDTDTCVVNKQKTPTNPNNTPLPNNPFINFMLAGMGIGSNVYHIITSDKRYFMASVQNSTGTQMYVQAFQALTQSGMVTGDISESSVVIES